MIIIILLLMSGSNNFQIREKAYSILEEMSPFYWDYMLEMNTYDPEVNVRCHSIGNKYWNKLSVEAKKEYVVTMRPTGWQKGTRLPWYISEEGHYVMKYYNGELSSGGCTLDTMLEMAPYCSVPQLQAFLNTMAEREERWLRKNWVAMRKSLPRTFRRGWK